MAASDSLWKPAMVLPRNRASAPALARGKVQSNDRCRYAEANFQQRIPRSARALSYFDSRQAPCARDRTTGVRLGPIAFDRPRVVLAGASRAAGHIREEVT